jgi:N-acetylglutamate synthase-like GNAT family acetyltransferase
MRRTRELFKVKGPKTMEHTLRKFKKDDAPQVKELILGILTAEYPFDKAAYSDSDLEKIAQTYGGEKDAFLLIDEIGQVAGTVGIKMDSDESALLRRLFVDVKRRHRGYGSELVGKAIDFCKNNGYKKIFFRCTDRMADAMKLCKKNGFIETDTLSVSGFNIHTLEKSL